MPLQTSVAIGRSGGPSPAIVTAVALLNLTLATACGSSKAHTSEVRSGVGYGVTYAMQEGSGAGALNLDKLEVVTDGGAKVKVTSGSGENGYLVSDGTRAEQVGAGGAETTPVKVSDVRRYVVHDTDGTLAVWCPASKQAGTADVLNRATLHYTCPGSNPDQDPSLPQVEELWVDRQTGLVMQWNVGDNLHAKASDVDFHLTIAADAFSLPPPSGAQDQAHPAALFAVPRIGGGELGAVSYRGAPLVIVTGDAAGIRTLVDRLLHMTGGGKSPPVIALLMFDDFTNFKGSLRNPSDVAALAKSISASVGTFKVPVGIDFKGVAARDLASSTDVEDLSRETRVVLVDSFGTVARVASATATDDELKGWIGGLT